MQLKSLSQIEHIEGARIIVRSDLNVPIVNGEVRDTFRIMRALPTIQFLTSRGAKVILITHLGDDGSADLSPIVQILEANKVPLAYIRAADQGTVEKVASQIQNGNVLLLPNIRAFAGEKENDAAFGAWLASLGDVYVNDAFSVSHREHASIVGIPKHVPSYAGMQLLEEIEHLSATLDTPQHPFIAIFGGAKLATKIPLIQKLSQKADTTVIGGALLNQLLFARGLEIGNSLHDENEKIDLSLFEQPEAGQHEAGQSEADNVATPKMIVPTDVVVVRNGQSVTVGINEVEKEDTIVDIGLKSVATIEAALVGAKTVLWNGPMGKYEDGYGGATEALLNKLATLSETTKTTVGGGDTVALVSKLGLENKLNFVSTGGGATLDFLEKGTLPGIEALK